MLQYSPQNTDLVQEGEISAARSTVGAFKEVVAFLERRRAIIGRFAGLALLCGLAYILITPPTYTALAQLIIDAHKSAAAQPQTILGDPISDSAVVESQVEVLRSEGIARAVIEQLNLTQDPEFSGVPSNVLGRVAQHLMSGVRRILGPSEREGVDYNLSAALSSFGRKLEVRRVGLGYVLEIRFSSLDQIKAARIANAVVDAYTAEAVAAKMESSEKLDLWLQQRMAELRKRLTNSLAEVQQFKSKHELVDSSRGALENTAQLHDLEAVSQGYRAIYESFVQSYGDMLRAASPNIEARVITEAIPPTLKRWPRTSIILPLALCLGMLIGLPIAFWRDQSDDKLRSPAQIRAALGTRCLGVLPKMAQAGPSMASFNLAIWSAKVAVDVRSFSRPTQVIGVTSALPHEGKTTVAIMLGMQTAKTGTKTLIIDGCLRNQTLTNLLAPNAKAGFLDQLASHAALDKAVVTHQASNLHLLPATAKKQRDRDLGIASRSMNDVLEWARGEYGCVIIDLPPITESVDVWASATLLDGMILVVEWGTTDQMTVAEALGSLDLTNGQLIGVLLNKADVPACSRHRPRLDPKSLRGSS